MAEGRAQPADWQILDAEKVLGIEGEPEVPRLEKTLQEKERGRPISKALAAVRSAYGSWERPTRCRHVTTPSAFRREPRTPAADRSPLRQRQGSAMVFAK